MITGAGVRQHPVPADTLQVHLSGACWHGCSGGGRPSMGIGAGRIQSGSWPLRKYVYVC